MVSDILLKDNEVHVNGWRLVVNGADLIIDAGSVRRTGSSGLRRAIVHGPNDVLVINWRGDYPNGVIVHGSGLKVENSVDAKTLKVNDSITVGSNIMAKRTDMGLELGDENLNNAIVLQGRGLMVKGGLHIQQEAIFDTPVKTSDIEIVPSQDTGDVGLAPYSLLQRIAELEARIQVLENA